MSDKFVMAGTGDVEVTQCLYCKNRVQGVFPIACPAFPAGIPAAILSNEFDHRRPHPDDRGIRFDPREEFGDEVGRLYGWLDAKAK